MDRPFWLIEIDDVKTAVSLVSKNNVGFYMAAVGKYTEFSTNDQNSILEAVDHSLSETAAAASISSEEEPSDVALIIPPYWVGLDGKIFPDRLKLFDFLFKNLELKPAGFITYDDALVEVINQKDGFPGSFILMSISGNLLSVSLVYLGKVIERINKQLVGEFNPQLLEDSLLEFTTESTLPPEIIIIGEYDQNLISAVKNHPWLGKKDIETFLHFPDIKYYEHEDLVSVFFKAIISQFSPSAEISINDPQDALAVEDQSPSETELEPIEEVPSELLGFKQIDSVTPIEEPIEDIANNPQPESVLLSQKKSLPKLNLPKLSLPKIKPIKFPGKKIVLILLGISPILIVPIFLFYHATITLYLTPVTIDKTVAVNLSQEKKEISISTLPLSVKGEITTTGQLTTGEKSKGEIVIYNKTDKTISLPIKSILTDSQGKKYQTSTTVEIAASSQNLNEGIITLGQTKAAVEATEIGEEYNLGKDSLLNFKDLSNTIAVAKVKDSLVGGIKKQVPAVSAIDQANLIKQLQQNLENQSKEKLSELSTKKQNIIEGSVSVSKDKADLNREIGEEAEKLTGSIGGLVKYYYLSDEQKNNLLKSLLATETDFNQADITQSNFTFSINSSKSTADNLSGQLTIKGQMPFKVDTTALKKIVAGKYTLTAFDLIKKSYPRVYNYQINKNLPFLSRFLPLPFNPANIKIEIK